MIAATSALLFLLALTAGIMGLMWMAIEYPNVRRRRRLTAALTAEDTIRIVREAEARTLMQAQPPAAADGWTRRELELGVNATDQLIADIDRQLKPIIREQEREAARLRFERLMGEARERAIADAEFCPACGDEVGRCLEAHLDFHPDCKAEVVANPSST